ncbi:MAG: aminotransferase class I/II-fold pyridoxal phosphate-dependent enzyme [Christensenellales bacterium]
MQASFLESFFSSLQDEESRAAEIVSRAHRELGEVFQGFEKTALANQNKVLNAFREQNIAVRHFTPTTGYGYGDDGRDALDRVFASALRTQDALVRPQIVSGTHAIVLSLQGLLQPGDTLVSATGKPYDTIEQAIGISGDAPGSLKSFSVSYLQSELNPDGSLNMQAIVALAKDAKVVFFQRSRGYAWRKAIELEEMGRCIREIKKVNPTCAIVVDNCYGEFVEEQEPTDVGADLIAGSLIKNPGGGLAPTGGYVAGKATLVERVAQRLTCPGIGREVGSYAQSYRPFYQGLFLAPHTVCQALKGAALFARIFEIMGMKTLPLSTSRRSDIIQSVQFEKEEMLVKFCQTIQSISPVDSHVLPYPWEMPGYQDQVIMAAGAFVEGSSIELSADGPIKPPYIAYLQGGLTYEHCILAAFHVAKALF